MKKRIISLLLCVVMLLPVLCGAAMADSEGRNCWMQLDGIWYYYDDDGMFYTGWLKDGGKWYYLEPAMVRGNERIGRRMVIDGVPYYFTSSGALATTTEEANNLYNITSTGAIATGWQYVNGHWNYYYADGTTPEGWFYDNGKWYFFRYWMMEDTVVSTDWFKGPYYYVDKNGVADDEPYTGWFKGSFGLSSGWQYYNNGVPTDGWLYNNGKWYYFMPGGGDLLQNTWSEIDGVRYLFSPSGALASGWQYCKMWWWLDNTEPNRWYYADENGVIQTGWLRDNGKWYYLDPELDGGMVTGWLKRGSNWYYMYDSGAMATGWYRSPNGVWYYLDPETGAMATSWTQIGGKWYLFRTTSGVEGSMLTGWYHGTSGNWYYLDPASGAMVTGTKTINGKTYTFDSNGVWVK